MRGMSPRFNRLGLPWEGPFSPISAWDRCEGGPDRLFQGWSFPFLWPALFLGMLMTPSIRPQLNSVGSSFCGFRTSLSLKCPYVYKSQSIMFYFSNFALRFSSAPYWPFYVSTALSFYRRGDGSSERGSDLLKVTEWVIGRPGQEHFRKQLCWVLRISVPSPLGEERAIKE